MNRILRRIFYLLTCSLFLSFLFLEFYLPNERDVSSSEPFLYEGTFFWEKSDGTRQEITIPGTYPVAAGETMTITTTLPEDFNEKGFSIRSSFQDIYFYIDGELRSTYDTSKTRLFGANSISRYVFCSTSSQDAGKELTITLHTNATRYTGVVNSLYCGDRMDIWESLFSQYGLGTIIGIFILFTGIITVIFNLALSQVYQTVFDMEYLGWCMVLGGTWILGESKFRQLMVPNASILGSLCFVMVLLCPLPALFYANALQKGKYQKLFDILSCVVLCNFLLCTFLHIAGIADFVETLPLGHAMLILTFVIIVVTFFYRFRHAKNNVHRATLVGLVLSMSAVIVESISVYMVISISDLYLAISMVILLFINIISTVQKIRDLEFHRRQEHLQNEKIQLDLLTGLLLRNKGEGLIKNLMQECNGCLVFLDMDNLKKINDLYGHKAGDRALKLLGSLIMDTFPRDIACRFGGDEFLLFLSKGTKESVTATLETFFQNFRSFKEQDNELKSISLSAGLYLSSKGERFETCYQKADQALYYVKQNGKNNFYFYEAPSEETLDVSQLSAELTQISKTLRRSGTYSGAMHLEYREFATIYEYMHHLIDRYPCQICLATITLDISSSQNAYIETMERSMDYLDKIIRRKIRSTDICHRYNSTQYLIILFEAKKDQVPSILHRIIEEYEQAAQHPVFPLKYEYIPIKKDLF